MIIKCKIKFTLSVVVLLLLLTGCDNQFSSLLFPDKPKPPACTPDTTPVTFKKVGFWSENILDDSQDLQNDYKLINYASLDTLNYSFIQIDGDGTIIPFSSQEIQDRFVALVALARVNNPQIRVGISIGGDDDTNFNKIAETQFSLNTFAKNIVYCLNGDKSNCPALQGVVLDGIDLYWKYPEGNDEAKRFESMVKTLSEAIRPLGKYFSITIVSGKDKDSAKGIRDDVFQYVDYANVMAFNPDQGGELDSTLQDAKDAIAYWTSRCVIKNKIVLGVPFYSGGSATESYMKIIGTNPPSTERACRDDSAGRDYNGIPTIINKTKEVQTTAGGIMMRSIEYDILSNKGFSLIDAIDNTQKGIAVTTCN
ncbi:MAG: glycoside hydrolase family 18 protein [Psychromonas sp.]|nr:glycoside hydrolase family 18 protein [Psychromonas sp.]